MMSVFGMDLATRGSGFCFIPAGWDGDQRHLLFGGNEYDLTGKIPEKTKINVMLGAAKVGVRMIRQLDPDEMVMEALAYHAKGTAVSLQAEIAAIVKSQILLAVDRVPELRSASTARKFLTGGIRGNRKDDRGLGIRPLPAKEQVKNFLRNRGMVFATDDQMDAFVVAYYHYCQMNGEPCRFEPIKEHEQVAKRRVTRR